MALKKELNEREQYGLTPEEIKAAERYLRKYKTKGSITEVESMKLYELYMVGVSFAELRKQFPQYELGQIVLTAALRGWPHDRDRMQDTLRERVRAKIVKSVLEQVDYLTVMLSVTNAEHLDAMRQYIIDPVKNPKPNLRIASIKEYKEVVETLHKIVTGTAGGSGKTSVFNVLEPKATKSLSGGSGDGDEAQEQDSENDDLTLDAALDEDNDDSAS